MLVTVPGAHVLQLLTQTFTFITQTCRQTRKKKLNIANSFYLDAQQAFYPDYSLLVPSLSSKSIQICAHMHHF